MKKTHQTVDIDGAFNGHSLGAPVGMMMQARTSVRAYENRYPIGAPT
jgi:hypothetical protein